jgi:hypothetical protein
MWLVSVIGLAVLAASVIALVWLLVLYAWLAAVSYGYIMPTSTPWFSRIAWDLVWQGIYDVVTVSITFSIVLDTALRFDRIAGRMAGGTVATTVDQYLHGRGNKPVFMPSNKKAVATAPTPSPDVIPQPVGSVGAVID